MQAVGVANRVQAAEDSARPIMFYGRGGISWQPRVKALTIMVNSLHNSNRTEDVWLNR